MYSYTIAFGWIGVGWGGGMGVFFVSIWITCDIGVLFKGIWRICIFMPYFAYFDEYCWNILLRDLIYKWVHALHDEHQQLCEKLTCGYQNYNLNEKKLILGEYVKVSESLNFWVIIGINSNLNHIGTKVIFSTYGGSCMVYRTKLYRKH